MWTKNGLRFPSLYSVNKSDTKQGRPTHRVECRGVDPNPSPRSSTISFTKTQTTDNLGPVLRSFIAEVDAVDSITCLPEVANRSIFFALPNTRSRGPLRRVRKIIKYA